MNTEQLLMPSSAWDCCTFYPIEGALHKEITTKNIINCTTAQFIWNQTVSYIVRPHLTCTQAEMQIGGIHRTSCRCVPAALPSSFSALKGFVKAAAVNGTFNQAAAAKVQSGRAKSVRVPLWNDIRLSEPFASSVWVNYSSRNTFLTLKTHIWIYSNLEIHCNSPNILYVLPSIRRSERNRCFDAPLVCLLVPEGLLGDWLGELIIVHYCDGDLINKPSSWGFVHTETLQ